MEQPLRIMRLQIRYLRFLKSRRRCSQQNDDFTFKVTITGIDGTYSTNVAGKTITNGTETEFTLRHGETFVVKNLPENASYTVVETDKKVIRRPR